MTDTRSTEEGWCGGCEVSMEEGRPTAVLGPDGEPLRYLLRHRAGFDLRPRKQAAERSEDRKAGR